MKKIKIVFLLAIVTVFSGNLIAQEIGVSLGAMRNYSTDEFSNSKYSFYPEISISNDFFIHSIDWEFAFGYVNDRLDGEEIKPPRVSDGDYFNNTDYILSFRFTLTLSAILNYTNLPEIVGGCSFHIVNSEYVYPPGFEMLSYYVPDKSKGKLYFDAGLEYKVAEIKGIDIVPRYLAAIPLTKNDYLHNEVKHSVVISFRF